MTDNPMTTEAIAELCRSFIARHPAENEAAGRQMLRNLRSGPSVEGAAVRGLYVPKILSENGCRILSTAGIMTERICEKAIRRYRGSESFRKLFAFDEELEELARLDPGYETLLPVLRVDVFYNERTGDFRFCELNADGSSGMIEDRVLNEEFRRTPLCAELEKSGKIESFELFDSLAKRYMEIYREYKEKKIYGEGCIAASCESGGGVRRGHAGGPAGARPTAAVVDFLEYASSPDEFEAYRRSFEKAGARAIIADARDLVFDGKNLICRGGGRVLENGSLKVSGREDAAIDLIYRRAVTSDILAHPQKSSALREAYRAGAVCLLGGFCTQAVHDKAFFTAIQSREAEEFLTAEEREFLRRHLPETVSASEVSVKNGRDGSTVIGKTVIGVPDTSDASGTERTVSDSERSSKSGGRPVQKEPAARFLGENRRNWVIKPRSAYGSRGIFIGKECTADEWEKQLAAAAQGDALIQEYVEPFASPNIDYSEENPQLKNYLNTTGIYLFGGRFAGIYSRASEHRVISTSKGGFDLASCVFSF